MPNRIGRQIYLLTTKHTQTMTHNIIKTENYLLVVDDSEIKQNDWCIYRTGEVIHYLVKLNTDNLKKIIAHLPLNNSPVLEGVPLLPPLEDEVGELAQKYVEDEVKPGIEPRGYNQDLRIGIYGGSVTGFIEGYNKAKEKYKFTEDDLREALFEALNTPKEECCVTHTKDSIVRRVIKSLQQPKMPVGFDCEWTTKQMPEFHQDEPKTTTNSQGQTVLVGKYIY